MRDNEKLEEIFDRYAGLELLNRDWTEATRLPGSGTGRDSPPSREARGTRWFRSGSKFEPVPLAFGFR